MTSVKDVIVVFFLPFIAATLFLISQKLDVIVTALQQGAAS